MSREDRDKMWLGELGWDLMVRRARAMLTGWGMLEGWGSNLLGVIVVSGEAVGEVDKDVGRDT